MAASDQIVLNACDGKSVVNIVTGETDDLPGPRDKLEIVDSEKFGFA